MHNHLQTSRNKEFLNQPKGGSDTQEKLLSSGAEHRTKRKGGRPPKPKDQLLCKCVKVYFDEQTYQKLKYLEKRDGKSVSEICRDFINQGYTVEPVTKEQTDYFRKLAGMSNNCNQLAHEAHIHYDADLAKRIATLADDIDALMIRESAKVTH